MNVLLVPEDEAELATFVCEDIGAELLLSEHAPNGIPQVASSPVDAIPGELPKKAKFGSVDVYTLTFWLPAVGAIRTMKDAPDPADVRDSVADRLTRGAVGPLYEDLIDMRRTPVLRLSRSIKMLPTRLAPGQFQSMPIASRSVPDDVKRLHGMVMGWLQKRGTRLDPFEHCPEVADRRPKNLGSLVVWAQPHAMDLVRSGTEVWPWNG